jgi:hypothetical protein
MVIMFLGIFQGITVLRALFRRNWFHVPGSKIVKTGKQSNEVSENIIGNILASYIFGKGFWGKMRRNRKTMSFTIVFNVLQEGIKEMLFFRNRGFERFDRGEMRGKGFGGGHNGTHTISSFALMDKSCQLIVLFNKK